MDSPSSADIAADWPTTVEKAGWLPQQIDRAAITHRLSTAEQAVLVELADKCSRMGKSMTEIRRADFSHPAIDAPLARLLGILKTGPGLIFITNLPYSLKAPDHARRIYWGIGTHFGTAVSQNNRGEMLGEVRVRSDVVARRAYGNSAGLILHTDRIDILSLFCVSQPLSGGANLFVSGLKIWDTIAEERPDLLSVLQRGFYQNRLGEHLHPGEENTDYRVPVFGRVERLRSVLFSGNAAIDHQRKFFSTQLTSLEEEALIYLAAVRDRPQFGFPATLGIGDAAFINNHEVLHSREAFEDGEAASEKRLLLRLWLQGRPVRPKPEEMTVMRNPSGLQGIDPRPEH